MKTAFMENTPRETSFKDAISKSRSNGMPVEMLFKGQIR